MACLPERLSSTLACTMLVLQWYFSSFKSCRVAGQHGHQHGLQDHQKRPVNLMHLQSCNATGVASKLPRPRLSNTNSESEKST